jgi:D-serine deaminase-like pyridoxal phosphate-dependent protein
LIANQVVGVRKILRLVNLAAYTKVKVAVDSIENVLALSNGPGEGLSWVCWSRLHIGNNRCGVEPFKPSLRLAQIVQSSPGLKFQGLMGYDGHLVFEKDFEARDRRSRQAYQVLADTGSYIEQAGIPVEIVSGGGSVTYRAASSIRGMTELQPGTYIFMDTTFQANGLSEFECSLSVLATVISRPQRPEAEDVGILDVGRKAFDLTYGFPEVKYPRGTIFSMPQEHSRIRYADSGLQLGIGEKVELWVKDANGTVNPIMRSMRFVRRSSRRSGISLAGER